MEKELIGHVGVDSGQLLLCDPCYIDSEWEKEDFRDLRVFKHKETGEELTYPLDFSNFQEIIPKYGKNMNDLIATEDWKQIFDSSSKHPFSYNSCCKKTLSEKGHGQLDYKMGHPGVGVAFSTAFGDGVYPVYAIYGDDGFLVKVEVLFTDYEEE